MTIPTGRGVVWLDTPPFPEAARRALADDQLRANLRQATTTIRDKRLRVTGELSDWEQLRAAGAAIKADVGRHLDRYLVQLEESVTRAGGIVHWARDADEATGIAGDLIEAAGAREVVKVKSMVTQEIDLNTALAAQGHRGVRDRPGRAHRPARRRPSLPHPGARDPPQPHRDP